MKSGNLNFLEPSGFVQASNGTALLFYWINYYKFYGLKYLLSESCRPYFGIADYQIQMNVL
jgi:hypothetical protein